MSKKMTKSEATFISILLIIGAPIYFIYKVGESIGWIIPISIIILIVVLVISIKRSNKKKRLSMLMSKYKAMFHLTVENLISEKNIL